MSRNVALKFAADWCAACIDSAPVVEEVFAQRPDIELRAIDIDQDPMLAFVHKVYAVPAIVLLKDDEVVGRVDGAVNEDTLTAHLDYVFGTSPPI